LRRSPIVLTATVAGTAGVLAFHPHSPAVQTATASSSAAPAATATATATTTAAKASSATATGASIATQYGNAQVRVTVKGGKIVKVEALALQGNDPRSVQISSSAEPVLQQEVLANQTAAVDAVSGATFTSASYMQSVQSALDKLGFKAADGSRATLQVPQGGEHGGPGF
jgi:uncharacterized protein with FMN-binding domain